MVSLVTYFSGRAESWNKLKKVCLEDLIFEPSSAIINCSWVPWQTHVLEMFNRGREINNFTFCFPWGILKPCWSHILVFCDLNKIKLTELTRKKFACRSTQNPQQMQYSLLMWSFQTKRMRWKKSYIFFMEIWSETLTSSIIKTASL